MRLIIRQDETAAAEWAALHIADRIRAPDAPRPFVLGLPTGSSPLPVYRELTAMYRAGKLSFAGVVTFNMDEYAGLPPERPQSYRRFMMEHLFSLVDIDAGNIHLLDGCAVDADAQCAAYEAAIRGAGGIELFLGGMGEDGHIAFNEPGSSLASRTRVVALTQDTREVNARFFAGIDEVPRTALSVGVGTVMEAREVLIIATGRRKARALAACVEGGVSQMWTLSCLQMHPNATIVCDEAAALELKYGTVRYFKEIERL
jgi:glucosamine-6-phosphate deaminase